MTDWNQPKISDYLMETSLPIATPALCENIHPDYRGVYKEVELCVGYLGGETGTCVGDSGGAFSDSKLSRENSAK